MRREYRRRPLPDRFWEKVVVTDGCWEWRGAIHDAGYGIIQRGGRGEGVARAHRVSWEIANGRIPPGMNVLHRCDNPPCTRPDHLFLGTKADNSRDMSEKGRWRNQSRFTHDDIRAIRARRAAGEHLKSIAASYGVTIGCISNIANRRNWKQV